MMMMLFLRRLFRSKSSGRMHCFCSHVWCVVCVVVSKNTRSNCQLWKGKEKILSCGEAKKEEGEKQYLGFVNFFFEKEERRNREHVKNTEEHCYNDTQNRINTRNNVGWNAVRAPSHAEGTKATLSFVFFLSFFLSDDVFVFLSSFYDNERCWFFPTQMCSAVVS